MVDSCSPPLSSPDSGAVAAAQVVRGSEGGRALPGEAGQLPPGPRISPHQRHHVLLHQGEVGERLRPRGQGVLPALGGGRVLVSTPLPGETCMGCLKTPLLFVLTLKQKIILIRRESIISESTEQAMVVKAFFDC